MGQISIPMSNKTGYSMYWNSMWDNKISYTRSLKEDIYLNKIINLFFEDNLSFFLIKELKKKKKVNIKKYNIYRKFQKIDDKMIKYLKKVNRFQMYPSKLWILKYQKWIILYYFIYIPYFNKFNKKRKKFIIENYVENNFFDLYVFYKKINFKIKYSYKFFKKIVNKNVF